MPPCLTYARTAISSRSRDGVRHDGSPQTAKAVHASATALIRLVAASDDSGGTSVGVIP